jgi:hypothetical protein
MDITDISFQSLFIFIIITMAYFVIKPKLTLDILENTDQYNNFYYTNLRILAVYLGIVVTTQLGLNIKFLMNRCGGSLDKNIGAAAFFTFIPWLLIFGIMVAVLITFPGFKSAFSDVIGYYVVAGKANDIFSSILMGTDLNEMIEKTENVAQKNELTQAAEAIVKICGNKSILINQMNPDNFLDIWNVLRPLMKNDSFDNREIKEKLLNLVILKDNIGEAFWYIYTSILVSSIVYYNLAMRGCVKSVEQIKSEHDEYIKKQEEIKKKDEINNSVTYTA